jgi:hypothetical protein
VRPRPRDGGFFRTRASACSTKPRSRPAELPRSVELRQYPAAVAAIRCRKCFPSLSCFTKSSGHGSGRSIHEISCGGWAELRLVAASHRSGGARRRPTLPFGGRPALRRVSPRRPKAGEFPKGRGDRWASRCKSIVRPTLQQIRTGFQLAPLLVRSCFPFVDLPRSRD